MTFEFTDKQKELLGLCTDHKNVMAYGGSRSGKTFGLVYAVVTRALKEPSRHLIARYRFNHVKQSIIYDTLPAVMKLAYPNVPYEVSKTDWFAEFPNGSQIWFGGLDDKERVEKILGNEYATIYLNECSQIPERSKNTVKTRLAQKTGLVNRMFYDCNPPSRRHWTYQDFIENPVPDSACIRINPQDNQHNISEDYIKLLEGLPEDQRKRFLLGEFADAVEGAYYSSFLNAAEKQGRITSLSHEPMLKTNTVWDLGMSDSTAIWFYQIHGNEIRVIDCYENNGNGLQHYVDVLEQKAKDLGYRYDRHIAPHDIQVRELGTGQSRLETAKQMGIKFDVAPNLPIHDGIQAVRNILPRCYFDKIKCRDGLDALREYRQEFDDKANIYKDRPLHDWTSHLADAFRYLALTVRDELSRKTTGQIKTSLGRVW